MAFKNDRDWEFLDRLIALGDDIINQANAIKDISDDPDVLLETLRMESAGLIIKKSARDYRSRLRRLKEIEEQEEINTAGKKVEGPLGSNEPSEANQQINGKG